MRGWLVVMLALLPAEALACATCIGAPWDKLDLGFFWSALFLMGVPVLVAGTIGGWLFYHSRRGRRAAGGSGTGRFVWTKLMGTRKESEE